MLHLSMPWLFRRRIRPTRIASHAEKAWADARVHAANVRLLQLQATAAALKAQERGR